MKYHLYEDYGGVGYFDGLPIEVSAPNPQLAIENHISSSAYDRGAYTIVVVDVDDDPNLHTTPILGYWRN